VTTKQVASDHSNTIYLCMWRWKCHDHKNDASTCSTYVHYSALYAHCWLETLHQLVKKVQ